MMQLGESSSGYLERDSATDMFGSLFARYPLWTSSTMTHTRGLFCHITRRKVLLRSSFDFTHVLFVVSALVFISHHFQCKRAKSALVADAVFWNEGWHMNRWRETEDVVWQWWCVLALICSNWWSLTEDWKMKGFGHTIACGRLLRTRITSRALRFVVYDTVVLQDVWCNPFWKILWLKELLSFGTSYLAFVDQSPTPNQHHQLSLFIGFLMTIYDKI